MWGGGMGERKLHGLLSRLPLRNLWKPKLARCIMEARETLGRMEREKKGAKNEEEKDRGITWGTKRGREEK